MRTTIGLLAVTACNRINGDDNGTCAGAAEAVGVDGDEDGGGGLLTGTLGATTVPPPLPAAAAATVDDVDDAVAAAVATGLLPLAMATAGVLVAGGAEARTIGAGGEAVVTGAAEVGVGCALPLLVCPIVIVVLLLLGIDCGGR